MFIREPAHAKEEKAIFDAFLVANPSFAGQVKKVDEPDASFPDVVVELLHGGLVDFELGEWLDSPQTRAAKRYDAVAETMTGAIGPQGANPSPYFRAVMLCPQDGIMKFEPADRSGFRMELCGRSLPRRTSGDRVLVASSEWCLRRLDPGVPPISGPFVTQEPRTGICRISTAVYLDIPEAGA